MNRVLSGFPAFPGDWQLNIPENGLEVFLRFHDFRVQHFPEIRIIAADGFVALKKKIII